MAEHEIVGRARAFARDVIGPNAATWERGRRQPVEALRAAADIGLLAFETPVEFGGMGLSYPTKLAICEALSRVDMAFTFGLINAQNIPAKLCRDLNADARRPLIAELMAGEVFGATALSEPQAGSDFASIAMHAARRSDGWILNGSKAWITNTAVADIFIVYAQTEPGSGASGIGAFLVDARRDGFERGPCYELLGGHAIGTGEFHVHDYFVPDSDLLSPPGEGFKHALGTVNGARVYVAAMCCGLIGSALDCAVEYGESRQAFGTAILEHQGLRWSLANVATQLEALRALTEKAGALIDAGEDAVLAAAIAKKFAGDVTANQILACMQAMGANGLRVDHPLTRHLAAAKIAAYADGSNEMMNERIAVSVRRRRG